MKNNSKKISAIIQARVTSTRLAGKVLMNIAGKPMLWHVIDRLKYSKELDDIILAIPDTEENNVLEEFAEKNKIKYFRGSEDDVLSRYYGAAKKFKCNVIVRITSDCPLIDPKIVDEVIKKHLAAKADFTANFIEGKKGISIKRTFPKGLETEVFNLSTLEETFRQAEKAYQREHVDPYIFEHPEIFRLVDIENKEDLSYMRWTVDEIEDLKFIREIYKRLYKKGKIFLMEDIVTLLKQCPELIEINKNVKQKEI